MDHARDHGLAPYTTWARHCGLLEEGGGWSSLSALISDSSQLGRLQRVYGSPDNVDLWVGGILEDPVEGGRVGPTLSCLLVDQFARLRAGDRFWYENPAVFSPAQLAQLRQASLGRVLCDNGDDIWGVGADVFLTSTSPEDLEDCASIPSISLKAWTDCSLEEVEVRRRRRDTGEGEVPGAGAVLAAVKEVEAKRVDEEEEEVVCLDSSGLVRRSGEEWQGEGVGGEGECAHCVCRGHVTCKLRNCH